MATLEEFMQTLSPTEMTKLTEFMSLTQDNNITHIPTPQMQQAQNMMQTAPLLQTPPTSAPQQQPIQPQYTDTDIAMNTYKQLYEEHKQKLEATSAELRKAQEQNLRNAILNNQAPQKEPPKKFVEYLRDEPYFKALTGGKDNQ